MMDGSLVAQVGFDVVWMNIDGIRLYVALYWIVGGLSSAVAKLKRWDDDPMLIVLFLVLCIILYIFKSC
jgi:hypothetical protein